MSGSAALKSGGASIATPGPAAQPLPATAITLSFGRNVRDVRPVVRTLTFTALIGEFSSPDTTRSKLTSAEYHALDKNGQRNEKDGRYFSVATYKSGGTRQEKDIDLIHGIALDFDTGRTKEPDIREILKGTAYIAYTSFSHRPAHEKWRVFIPFKEPLSREQFEDVYDHFQLLFGGDLDDKCESPQQPWYTPACPHDAGGDYRMFYEEGVLFDATAVRPAAKKPKTPRTSAGNLVPVPSSAEFDRLAAALKHIDSDERQTWIEVGLAIKHDLGDAGRAVWLEWSACSPKFEEEEALETWESFKPREADQNVVTLGTVFFKAKQAGWQDIPEFVRVLNKEYFVSQIGGKVAIYREDVDHITCFPRLTPMKKEDFCLLLRNKLTQWPPYSAKKGSTTVAEAWLSDPYRREYDGVVLSPSGAPLSYYNRWRGFSVTPARGPWRRMRRHIRHILCGGDRLLYRYVFDWLAFCVQKPAERPEVALVLQGGRGTGKGMMVRAFGSLFGPHFVHITQSKHLTGHFNAHIADALVVFADEAFWAGDKSGEGSLKALITEPTVAIEPKFFNVEMVPNRLKVIMASNNDWVVPAGMDERRFCVLAVSDAQQQNSAYFSALQAELDAGGKEAMLHDLLHRDIREFNVRQVPNTGALKTQKILSMLPVEKWFLDKLTSGEWTEMVGSFPSPHAWMNVPKVVVHDDFVRSLQKVGVSRKSTQTELGMALRKLLPAGWPGISRQLQGSQQVEHYTFPPLADCRAHFEKVARIEGYDWP